MIQIFQTHKERLDSGVRGSYPEHLLEIPKLNSEIKHQVNEQLTRPWIKHYFLTQQLRDVNSPDDIISRDDNLIQIFKTTIPLMENSFIESTMSAWRMFIDSAFRDADAYWYCGIRKTLNQERLHSAIEQLELEVPASNTQRAYQFHDHRRATRKIPRVPIKLFFALPGNEREKLIELLRQAVSSNPHNIDIILLTYSFYKAWDRPLDFLNLAKQERRGDIEEWYYWVESDMKNLGALKRSLGDFTASFYVYDRALLNAAEYKEIADWFLKESEFKAAYHFYYKAKEFETALDIFQNISTKEFAELTNQRRTSKGERPFDVQTDSSRFTNMYQEEMETLRGFARIRSAETYKQVAAKARQHFDRETIETKYAFGELSEDEYQRLLRQIAERQQ